MEFRVSNVSNLLRVFLDAPYKDGYENIKASLSPRITYAFWRISIRDRVVDLSERFIQCGTALVLIIPGVNVVVYLALRFFIDPNQKTLEPLSNSEGVFVTDKAIIEKILPRILDFLDENGMKDSSIYYCHSTDMCEPISLLAIPYSPLVSIPFFNRKHFIIKLNNDRTLNIWLPTNQNCENAVFTKVKKEIIQSGLLTNKSDRDS